MTEYTEKQREIKQATQYPLLFDSLEQALEAYYSPEHIQRCADRQTANILAGSTSGQSEQSNRNTKPGYVYLLQSPTSASKIGVAKQPEDRMRTFSVKLPFEVSFTCLIATEDMYGLEKELHNRFAAKRINGEWFALDAADVEYIKGLAK